MKKILVAVNFFFFSMISSQYSGLKIEKIGFDRNNNIYKIGRTFQYSYKILKNGENFITSSEDDEIILLSNSIVNNKYLVLKVINPKIFQRTNKYQTEIRYSIEPNPASYTYTGVVENKENVWIHPPRIGFLRSLEICPFPYIKLNKPIGYTWEDSMSISNSWSNKEWGVWTGRLLLRYNYKIISEEYIDTSLGKLLCTKIIATAKSDIGTSELILYFSKSWGFVKLNYTLPNNVKIFINLEKIYK